MTILINIDLNLDKIRLINSKDNFKSLITIDIIAQKRR